MIKLTQVPATPEEKGKPIWIKPFHVRALWAHTRTVYGAGGGSKAFDVTVLDLGGADYELAVTETPQEVLRIMGELT